MKIIKILIGKDLYDKIRKLNHFVLEVNKIKQNFLILQMIQYFKEQYKINIMILYNSYHKFYNSKHNKIQNNTSNKLFINNWIKKIIKHKKKQIFNK